MSNIGIIAALPAEAKCWYKGKLSIAVPVEIDDGIFLCLSGMGDTNASTSMQKLLEHPIDAVISWGVAGAIDAALTTGDLLIANTIIATEHKYHVSVAWLNKVKAHYDTTAHITFGSIVSTTNMVLTPKAKHDLSNKTQALAVDMESAAIATQAIQHNKDFLVVRAIADDVTTHIPPAVSKHTDILGRPHLTPFIFSCIQHPKQIQTLIKLAHSYKKALQTLKQVIPDFKAHRFFS